MNPVSSHSMQKFPWRPVKPQPTHLPIIDSSPVVSSSFLEPVLEGVCCSSILVQTKRVKSSSIQRIVARSSPVVLAAMANVGKCDGLLKSVFNKSGSVVVVCLSTNALCCCCCRVNRKCGHPAAVSSHCPVLSNVSLHQILYYIYSNDYIHVIRLPPNWASKPNFFWRRLGVPVHFYVSP
jgi:hypothetical protein